MGYILLFTETSPYPVINPAQAWKKKDTEQSTKYPSAYNLGWVFIYSFYSVLSESRRLYRWNAASTQPCRNLTVTTSPQHTYTMRRAAGGQSTPEDLAEQTRRKEYWLNEQAPFLCFCYSPIIQLVVSGDLL